MSEKRHFGDRKDGKLLRDIDSMHFITPLIYPNRCDNEAYISQRIDLAPLNAWLEEHNQGEPQFRYTMFHLIVAAMLKAITLRPRMNRFIANKNMYQRNEITAAFTVKKIFSDKGGEALAFLHAQPEDNIFTLHQKLYEQIAACRSDAVDPSTNSMNIVQKIPRFIAKALVAFIRFLDRHGWCPNFLIASDPYYASVLLSNVGSIKLKSGYHHLTNWGTCSIFCLIGEKALTPSFDAQGNVTMRETVDLGLTIDERLADGYYYSKTVRLLKTLLEHPELLELPLCEEVDY